MLAIKYIEVFIKDKCVRLNDLLFYIPEIFSKILKTDSTVDYYSQKEENKV